jgi:hypothetical protein
MLAQFLQSLTQLVLKLDGMVEMFPVLEDGLETPQELELKERVMHTLIP